MMSAPMIGRLHLAVAIVAMIGCDAVAYAQGAPKSGATSSSSAAGSGPPNALQGFSQNRDKPIRIDADRLEVRDKQKVATFFGDAKADVKVVQGDTTMRSKILVVFYDKEEPAKSEAGKAGQPTAAAPGEGSQIKRLEARGNVVVTQKDQTVTGDNGVFDMKTNIATVSGSVVMTQCDNVVRGDKLIVDMTTGVSRVENSGGRVQSTLIQSQSGCGGAAPAPAQPTAKR
jgi:lipopolysaccharide export system protein LptA